MDVFSFILAVNNTFSLVCILLFLSYGVVAIPRKYLHKKSIHERLSASYAGVYKIGKKIEEKQWDIEEIMSDLHIMVKKIKNEECKLEHASQYV